MPTNLAIDRSFVVSGAMPAEAITESLRALLPARRRPIAGTCFTVLDTFDGRLRRAGASLTRFGEDGDCTLTWRGGRRGSQLSTRVSEPVSFAWDLPDGPLKSELAPIIGARRLLPVADADERGSLLEILDERNKTIARLRIASGQVRLPATVDGWRPLPTMVTLTPLRGYEDSLDRLVPVIESRPGISPCPEGTAGVMLRLLGIPLRGDLSTPHVELAQDVRADVGARQIHAALVDLIQANEPGLRANVDTEFLHDFRVAVRRTRSLLGQLRQVFPADFVEHFSTEFSWLGRLTGPPRDMDVLLLSLRERRSEFPASDMEALLLDLEQAQRKEHETLVRALDSQRYRRLMAEWKSFLERPVLAEPDAPRANAPLADVIAWRAWRLTRKIADKSETVDERTPPNQLHELRIVAKKLRYLIDATPTPCRADDFERVMASLKKLQRVLGDFNDADVQERRLTEFARAVTTRRGVVFVLQRLAVESRERRDSVRDQIVERLARFRGGETRAACRRAFKRRRPEKWAR